MYTPRVPTTPGPQPKYHESISLARGEILGLEVSRIHGENPNVGTSYEDIWGAGGTFTGWLLAADTVRIRSGGNVNDTAAGTGTRLITIDGLDENWDRATETLVTAGASASASTTITFIRIFHVEQSPLGAGTYTGDNAGNILLEATGGELLNVMVAGEGESQSSMYTIPTGKVGRVNEIHISPDSNKKVDVHFVIREGADVVSAPFTGRRVMGVWPGLSESIDIEFHGIPPIPARTDVWFEAKADASGGGCAIQYSITLEDA